jgi:orotidine-5'-phosphate decarboxylase
MKGLYLAADMKFDDALALLGAVGDQFDAVKAHALTDPDAAHRIGILKEFGAKSVWDDIKGHDTPDTIAARVTAFMKAGADIVTVHASGGPKMMAAAISTGISAVYAVVFLTSLSQKEFERYYQPNAVENMIEDAMSVGIHGFICPPTKVAWLREHLKQFDYRPDIISPGTRFIDASAHDQQQVEAPGTTVAAGADYLVIGRMVTEAKDPREAMARLQREITAAKA